MLTLFFARGFAVVLGVYFVLVAFTSTVQPAADGLIARMAASHQLEYGRMRLWGGLGFAAISSLSGLLWTKFGYAPIFLACGTLFLLFAPSARLLEEGNAAPLDQRFRLSQALRDPGMQTALLVSLVVGLGWGLSTPFLGVYIEILGGNATQIGVLYAVAAIVSSQAMRLQGRGVQIIGEAGMLALGCACMAVNYGVIAAVRDPNWFIVSGALEGVGFASFFIGTVQIVDRRTEIGRSITMQSIRNGLTYGIAPLLTSPVGGFVFGRFGAGVFAITASLMLIGVLIALLGREGFKQSTHH